MTAVSMIKNYIDEYSKQIVAERLEKKDIDQSILTPINIVDNVVGDKDDGFGKIMASMMIPLLLMLYSATSTIGAAVDLGAGEKERGTLEPLLYNKSRKNIFTCRKISCNNSNGNINVLCLFDWNINNNESTKWNVW